MPFGSFPCEIMGTGKSWSWAEHGYGEKKGDFLLETLMAFFPNYMSIEVFSSHGFMIQREDSSS